MNARMLANAIAALVIATLSIALPSPAPAADLVPLAITLGPGSVLWLEGTSTVHDFESRSEQVEVAFLLDSGVVQPTDAAALFGLIRSSAVRQVLVQVPVLSLRSHKTALDKNLRRAMKADEHPDVQFELGHHTVTPAPGETLAIEAEGSLTVAGQKRPVSLAALVHRAAEGVWLEGSEPLLMSDYGIKPPTMMLGTLKVRDPITVRYRLLLIPNKGTSASPQPQEGSQP